MQAWLQLARIALFPTILWDFYAGLILVSGIWERTTALAAGTLLLLYHGGMMLNDLRDRAEDTEANRRRPLVDGRISVSAAVIMVMLFFVGAVLLAEAAGPHLRWPTLILLTIILAYDLSSSGLRQHLGPALLAAARGLSLSFAAYASFGFDAGLTALGYGPVGAYALFFLFVSRLAQKEEHGVQGVNGLSFLFMASLAPAVLYYDGHVSIFFLPAWILVAGYLLRPAFQARYEYWGPQKVQSMVRHSLGAAPLIPGLVLLASGETSLMLQSLIAIPVCLLVRFMARSWAPE
ncbi:MAG: UbiA family prenyltransferase [Planctomycetota bacterium]